MVLRAGRDEDTEKLRVAINNYRYTGGGRYNFKGLPIVYRSQEEIRELITEHLTRTGVIPTAANHNWRIEPREAVEALRKAALEQDVAAVIAPRRLLSVSSVAKPVHTRDAVAGN